MKIKTHLLVAIVICFLGTNAQTIKWGSMEKCTTDSRISKMIGSDAKGVYVIKLYYSHSGMGIYPPVYTLEKFDFPNMKREYSKEINLTEEGSEKGPEMYCDGIFCLKDNPVMVVYGNDVKTLYGLKVNADGSTGDKVKLGAVTNTWKKSILSESRYKFVVSKDKTVLIGYYVSATDKNKLVLKAIDENIKELWTKEIEDPFKGKKVANLRRVHSLNGEVVYVLASLGKSDDPDGYGLLVYNHNTDEPTVYNIELGDTKFPDIIDFDVDNSGNAVITGYYGDDKSKETVIGTFNVRVDKSGQGILTKTTPFDKDLLAHIIGDSKIAKGKGIENLGTNGIIVRDDGSAIISAEQGNFFSGNIGGTGAISETDCYDGIIAKIKSDGSVGWVKCIAKKQGCQYSGDAGYVCSYGLYIGANNLYVIYNDSKKNGSNASQDVLDGDNSSLSMNLLAVKAGHPVVVCETIDMSSGSAKKTIIQEENANDLRFYTGVSLQTSPGTAIIYSGDGGKNDKLGQLTIQ